MLHGLTRRATLAMGLLAAPSVRAQGAWNPSRPITLVVGFPPGGRTDFAARLMQPGMQAALGVAVEIDNRGGAGGNIGTEAVMSARPDGHTILVGNISPMAINPHTIDGMTIDPREMRPIGLALQSSLILCAHPSTGVQDLAGLRAWIAAQPPGSVQYGSSGAGSLTHIAMELFRDRIGKPEMTHVPHRGSAAAKADFIAGRFSLMFDAASVVAPSLNANHLLGVLATGQTRNPALPDIATAEQQGLRDFTFYAWIGLFAPRGTPPEAISRINAALNAALNAARAEPATRQRMASRGDEPGGGTPEQMGQMMAQDYARWGEVVRANSIRAET